MKYHRIPLSDEASETAQQEADALGIGVDAFLSAGAHEWLSARRRDSAHASEEAGQLFRSAKAEALPFSLPAAAFSVAAAFPKYPARTIALTQTFVNEALAFANVLVHKRARSLVFTPRFVFVDYPISNRGDAPGFVVSFYGQREQFSDPRKRLYSGRKSFSRMRVLTDEDLQDAIRFLRTAHELRVGNRQVER